ncbi:beta-1,4-mannosyltransferase [Nematocida sp. AWRm78]|nr:beta-1,4-mannosyltransferase [Nematocida sp. AWRm78]
MLIINLAPIDQSGRTLGIAKYISKNQDAVNIVSYRGHRSHSESQEKMLNISYVENIICKNKPFLLKGLFLMIKYIYITVISLIYLYRYKMHIYSTHRRASIKEDIFYSPWGTVIFVVPPTPTLVVPVLFAKLLGIRVIVDWHRIATGWMEKFDLLVARRVENICVTSSMRKYFINHRIGSLHLLTDIEIRQTIYKKSDEIIFPKSKTRRELFTFLAKKYPEYKDVLLGINMSVRMGVCSTSCSKEENIEKLLKEVSRILIPSGGILFVTTKEKISLGKSSVQIVHLFLDYTDYLDLLSVVDFGISTHECRFDFPLKIVDYLQSRLTVLAHETTPTLKDPMEECRIIRYKNNNHMRECLFKLFSDESS